MLGFFIFILFLIITYYGYRFIFRTENRVEAGIKTNGISKGLNVLYIREITRFDGVNPFLKLDVRISSVSTTFLGVNGEDTYYRIVTTQNKKGEEIMYWVRVDTVFFKPSEIRWVEVE